MNALLLSMLANAVLAAGLGVVVFVVTRIWRNPRLAHALWLLVLLKLVTPPLVPIYSWRVDLPVLGGAHEKLERPEVAGGVAQVVHGSEGQEVAQPRDMEWSPPLPTAATAASVEASPPVIDRATAVGITYPLIDVVMSSLVVLWIGGGICLLVCSLLQMRRIRRLIRHTRGGSIELKRLGEQVAQRMGRLSCPPLRMVESSAAPMVCAVSLRPTILLPCDLLQSLSREQQQMLLAHELAHLRRGDHLVRWFELVVVCFYWWHPVVWFARRELQHAADECCDAWVMALFPHQATYYAETLMTCVDWVSEGKRTIPAMASGFVRQNSIKRRFEMILQEKFSRGLVWPMRIGIIALAGLVLPVSAQIEGSPGDASSESRQPDDAESEATTDDALAALVAAHAAVFTSLDESEEGNVEERLARLERMMAEVAEIIKAQERRRKSAEKGKLKLATALAAAEAARKTLTPGKPALSQALADALSRRRGSAFAPPSRSALLHQALSQFNDSLQTQSIHRGLLLHYTFDGDSGRHLKDVSGKERHATAQNDFKFIPDGAGKALRLQGRGQQGSAGGHAKLPVIDFASLRQFTVALWVNETGMSFPHGEAYIAFGEDVAGAEHLGISHLNKDLIFQVGDGFVAVPYRKGDRGRWVHYAMTYRDGRLRAYRNARLVGEASARVVVQGKRAALGSHWWDNGTSTRFIGAIDDVRVYNRALTSRQIVDLRNARD